MALAGAACGLAEAGRRRGGGAAVFPASVVAWAPVWLGERAVCVWLALLSRLRGGARYGDGRLVLAAHSVRRVRRDLPGRPVLDPLPLDALGDPIQTPPDVRG